MISSSRASEKKRSLYCYLPVGKSAIRRIKRLRRVSYLGGFGRQWWHFRSSSQLAVLVSEGPPFCRGPLECGRNHLVEKGRSHTRDRGRKRLNLSRGLPNRREVYAKEEQEGRRGGGHIQHLAALLPVSKKDGSLLSVWLHLRRGCQKRLAQDGRCSEAAWSLEL